ncbi:thiopurine S-methyltransferase [Leptospira sarikeiensis]|uniref:Thiopurine S-methyltransferase n=1 Tax=Leptospira sarikeiensis TaxID=2484943 RepID=A0A4R9K1P1_9LEPT|nr:thiopurine S-methyltransferase [Leptospira sarikeiensis]TGL58734.1 thiopurine S-methyltransferase [Leptospira sarikeiensis]
MEADFWHQRWEKNEIAFHEPEANPLLVEYFGKLSLTKGSRVFIPLCGKTLDISWLLSNGYRVVGAELSKIAIEQLFQQLDMGVKKTVIGGIEHYAAENIDIFVGDIFRLSKDIVGSVNAIYDRAALVALPEKMRKSYTDHLIEISVKAPQLLVCYEYDQNLMEGPPFSISNEEVKRHYENTYNLNPLSSRDVVGGLKGKCPAKENVWLLQSPNP